MHGYIPIQPKDSQWEKKTKQIINQSAKGESKFLINIFFYNNENTNTIGSIKILSGQ
jgi:hypothetical protein